MATQKANKVPANDRSMQPATVGDGNRTFFFPKRKPPVSVRAASRDEAEKLVAGLDVAALSTPNTQEA